MKTKSLLALSLLFFSIFSFAQNENGRGKYFSKKKYVHAPIPTFTESKHKLPIPILTNDTGWISMYWKAWEIAFSNFKSPPKGSPLVSNFIDEAFNEYIFQWDTEFMVMFARYCHNIFPAIQSLDNFYCRQHDDGLIWRVITETEGRDHEWGGGEHFARTLNPPLFSWAEVETYKLTGDKSRFAMVLPVLEKYIDWIEKNRKCTNTPHKLYWTNGQASGMDNTPRDEGRADGHSSFSEHGWVDISSQMVLQYNNLAFMCKELKLSKKEKLYTTKAAAIATIINKWMWNKEDGMYYDVDEKGEQIKWKTIASFWPMLAGITNKEKNEKLVAHLKDTSSFWRRNVFPTLAANQKYYNPNGEYWLGGVWAPTNYMVIKGLENYEYNEFAYQATERYLNGLYAVYKNTGTLWEAYAPDVDLPATNEGGKDLVRKNFVGWTGCGPITLLIENILGIKVKAAENTIYWNINRQDTHGIKNLPCGKANVSLLYKTISADKYSIDTETETPFKLILKNAKGLIKVVQVKKGNFSFMFNK
jgi:glycogen debranching enzyme